MARRGPETAWKRCPGGGSMRGTVRGARWPAVCSMRRPERGHDTALDGGCGAGRGLGGAAPGGVGSGGRPEEPPGRPRKAAPGRCRSRRSSGGAGGFRGVRGTRGDSGGPGSAAATAAAAAATARGGGRGRGGAADCDRGQELDRVVVAGRAGRGCGGLRHGTAQFEGVAAGPAAVFVARHGHRLTGPARAGQCAPPRSSRICATTRLTVVRTASVSVRKCQ